MRYLRLFLLLLGLALLPSYSSALTPVSTHVKVELLQEEQTIQPGHPFWVAIHLSLEDDWHVYWKNPGDAGLPLKIEWKLPAGWQAEPLLWPFPEKFTIEDMVGFGYEKEVTLLAEMRPSQTLAIGAEIPIEAHVKWLVCSSLTCQPGSASAHLTLKVDSSIPQMNEQAITLFKQARSKLPASHVAVKTVHKEGVVQLQVPISDRLQEQESVLGVYFFPEYQNVIDHSIDPIVAINDHSNSHKYVVNLKGSDEVGVKGKNLKGVLVVHTQTNLSQQTTAFDIDSPIQEDEHELLSFVEISPTDDGLNHPVVGKDQQPIATAPLFEGGLGLALLFAFLGGMILNLMPCVLPVMSFKVMSFVKMAGKSRVLTLKHGALFSAGVIISFWVLASAMLILRAYGQAVGWGFQLQEPLFVVILASILFIFSLSLFGLFEWGIGVASWAGQTEVETNQKSSGYTSSFLSGVLATAVATPCTGPFLGSAVGFAVTLPVLQALLIFTVLGLGMCFPYLVLAAFPSFLRFIPKPGAWMETFKEIMGFGLLVTVLWLLWVFSAQTNTFSLICLLGGFLCFAMGAWIYGKGCSPLVKRSKKVIAYAVVAFCMILGIQVILFPRQSWYQEESAGQKKNEVQGDWEVFSPERIAELQKQEIPILIDFTAKWCLICQANHLALSTEEVTRTLTEMGVVKMKADWTKNDPVITQALSQFGRNSVPLYVLYGTNPTSGPMILPQVLTPEIVLEHLKSAIESEHIVLKE